MESASIVISVTTAQSAIFYTDLAVDLARKGWDIHFVASSPPSLSAFEHTAVTVHNIPMRREPSVLDDARSLAATVRLLWRIRPAAVLAGTPKASLFGMIAAWLTGVPVRIYHVLGLRYETAHGIGGVVLRLIERLTAQLATRVLSVSPSVSDRMVDDHISRAERIDMIRRGSTHGVRLEWFQPQERPGSYPPVTGLPSNATVVGYVGRITRDKGIDDLVDALKMLNGPKKRLHLLAVGPLDEHGYNPFAGTDFVTVVPAVSDTRPYYAAMDIFCLPTHREGLPNVNLEAAAMGLPIVTTTATGAVDSMDPNRTGVLVPPGRPEELAEALCALVDAPELRREMGRRGRRWVMEHYAADDVREATSEYIANEISRRPARGRGR